MKWSVQWSFQFHSAINWSVRCPPVCPLVRLAVRPPSVGPPVRCLWRREVPDSHGRVHGHGYEEHDLHRRPEDDDPSGGNRRLGHRHEDDQKVPTVATRRRSSLMGCLIISSSKTYIVFSIFFNHHPHPERSGVRHEINN